MLCAVELREVDGETLCAEPERGAVCEAVVVLNEVEGGCEEGVLELLDVLCFVCWACCHCRCAPPDLYMPPSGDVTTGGGGGGDGG